MLVGVITRETEVLRRDVIMQAISDAEKKFIIESADLNVRADGRGRLDYRSICVDACGPFLEDSL